MSLNDSPPYYSSGAASDYFGFTHNEIDKFEIDLSAKTLTGRKPMVSELPGQRDISRDRALLWNDQVHYYQDGTWQSAPW